MNVETTPEKSAEKTAKLTKNTPLNHEQVKDLKVQRDATKPEKVGLAYSHEFPNRAARRMAERKPKSTANRRNTPGRLRQTSPMMIKQDTAFGPVNVDTGYKRTFVHRVVQTKVWKSLSRIHAAIMGKKHPLMPAVTKEELELEKQKSS